MAEMSPLRRRMIEDMTIRNLSPATQRSYVHAVAKFAGYFGRSPDQLTLEDVRDYQLHLVARGLKASSICPIMSALRFFYGTTLGNREAAAAEIPLPRTVCAAGLRVSEVVGLQVGDIDSARMTIHVREGKGGRDRHVMLAPQLLAILRAHWRRTGPPSWLFPGPDPSCPITARSVQRACCQAVETAGLDKSVTVHTLRHSFATHLLEQNTDIRVIQVLLGHAKLENTALYTRVATKTIRQVMSPLEHIALKLKEIRPPS